MPRFVHAAIVEWYGGADAFTEYVRGPLQEELVSKQRTGVQISYCMMLVAPFLSDALRPTEVLFPCVCVSHVVSCGMCPISVASKISVNYNDIVPIN